MSKGSGGGGRGTRLSSVSIRGKSVESLFRSAAGTMRSASFAFLRGGGKASKSTPVTLTKYPDGSLRGTDGRHRITIAREQGKKSIGGVLRTMGPRGGVKTKKVRILL